MDRVEAWKKLAERRRQHGAHPGTGFTVCSCMHQTWAASSIQWHVPVRERMFTHWTLRRFRPLLKECASEKETADDPVAAVFGSAALGAARAAELLGRQYTLVATNVPYLAIRKQGDVLCAIPCSGGKDTRRRVPTWPQHSSNAVDPFAQPQVGLTRLVTPQNWLFLGSLPESAGSKSLLREQVVESHFPFGRAVRFNTIIGGSRQHCPNYASANGTLLIRTRQSVVTGLDVG